MEQAVPGEEGASSEVLMGAEEPRCWGGARAG